MTLAEAAELMDRIEALERRVALLEGGVSAAPGLPPPWGALGVTIGSLIVTGEIIGRLNCGCLYERDWGTRLCPQHVAQRVALLAAPIEIGKDGLCRCSGADPCPLGKSGSAVRCSAQQLADAGVPIAVESQS
jgi:hypothetical protein